MCIYSYFSDQFERRFFNFFFDFNGKGKGT